MSFRRITFLSLGIINVLLGAAGIILPLLPTTPFLLLAAYLFARSDERFHYWLMHQRHLSPYIHAFRGKKGLTKTQKIRIATSITIAMGFSIYITPINTVRCILAAFWVFWSVVIFRMKTATPAAAPEPARES